MRRTQHRLSTILPDRSREQSGDRQRTSSCSDPLLLYQPRDLNEFNSVSVSSGSPNKLVTARSRRRPIGSVTRPLSPIIRPLKPIGALELVHVPNNEILAVHAAIGIEIASRSCRGRREFVRIPNDSL